MHHRGYHFDPIAQAGRPAEFYADLIYDKPAIRPRHLSHRDAQIFKELAPAALKITKIVGMIYNALCIRIFQVNPEP
jgi:hypothetical protein